MSTYPTIDNTANFKQYNAVESTSSLRWNEMFLPERPLASNRSENTSVCPEKESQEQCCSKNTSSSTTTRADIVKDYNPLQPHDRLSKKNRISSEERALQRTMLQLFIDANNGLIHGTDSEEQWIEYHSGRIRLLHVNDIAKHIDRSPRSTHSFLCNYNDNLWIDFNGDRKLWYTSLDILPDRLLW